MEALDGNALAGPLRDHFGREMTAVSGACAHCGANAVLAELRVYRNAPGTVVRCRGCGGVVIVVLEVRDRVTVDHRHFAFDTPHEL